MFAVPGCLDLSKLAKLNLGFGVECYAMPGEKIKVSELEGAQLDYWVAIANGLEPCDKWKPTYGGWLAGECWIHEIMLIGSAHKCFNTNKPFEYSSIWNYGGPIIEREQIGIQSQPHFLDWLASDKNLDHIVKGKTALIAAMRCYVASKFGDEINA